MKKFERLGRSLSKNEMRKVLGGLAEPEDSKDCTTSADCGQRIYLCWQDTEQEYVTSSNGSCYQGKCRWGYICA
jgi:hypothetical protein